MIYVCLTKVEQFWDFHKISLLEVSISTDFASYLAMYSLSVLGYSSN